MVWSVRIIENIERGECVYLKENSLNVCGGAAFRVADFGIKNTSSAV